MGKKKAKILVVDDDEEILRLIEQILTHHGYEVIMARDGVEAVTTALQQQPALILLDILMPKMDGFVACNAIKTDEKTKAIPVIMLTAIDYELDKELSRRLNADGYLTKPFPEKTLLDAISQFVAPS
jgi:CheY-like chemotaxis protein